METQLTKSTEQETKTQKTSLHHLYDVYQSAIRSLDFYKEELQYLQKRLADLIAANTKENVLSQAEHFQNLFMLTQNNLVELKNRINKTLLYIEQMIRQKPTHADEKSVLDLGIYSRDLHDAERAFAAMKMEFNLFLAKYL